MSNLDWYLHDPVGREDMERDERIARWNESHRADGEEESEDEEDDE